MVYPKHRDPSKFLDYLCTLKLEFKFIVYTNNKEIFDKYLKLLGSKLVVYNYVPRTELIEKMSTVDFLINIKNLDLVQSPSKLIDYALSTRPILDISSDFKEDTNFLEFINGNYNNQTPVPNVDSYDIVNVAQTMLNLCSNSEKI